MSALITSSSRWLVVAAASLASACFWTTTRREGDALRAEVRALDQRVDGHERGLDGEVKALQASIAAASGGLRRDTADLGADLAAFEAEARVLRGRISALEHALENERTTRSSALAAIEGRLAALERPQPAAERPQAAAVSADSLWQQGRTAFEAARWTEAGELFGRIVNGHREHARADDAQYFLAEALRHQERWEAAIREYRRLFDERSASPLADDALFRAGESALRLRQCTEARTYFHLLRSRYPGSKLADAAARQERATKAQRTDRRRCQS